MLRKQADVKADDDADITHNQRFIPRVPSVHERGVAGRVQRNTLSRIAPSAKSW